VAWELAEDVAGAEAVRLHDINPVDALDLQWPVVLGPRQHPSEDVILGKDRQSLEVDRTIGRGVLTVPLNLLIYISNPEHGPRAVLALVSALEPGAVALGTVSLAGAGVDVVVADRTPRGLPVYRSVV